MNRVVYLDHHATTPLDDRVFEAMRPYFSMTFGNPASRTHRWGWEAKEAVDDARAGIASWLGASPEEIVFTSGATESLNLAIFGLAARHPERDHVVATAVEHPAVLDPLAALGRVGVRVELLPVDEKGRLDPGTLERALTDRTLAACLLHANNEVGTILDMGALAPLCRARGVSTIVDACQSVGHVPVDVRALGADLLAFSAHKFHGPKGVGALYVRDGVDLAPHLHGGGHERGLRPGTLNVPGIVGMAAALRLALTEMEAEATRIGGLRDHLQRLVLERIPEARVNGDPERRLPGNLSVAIAGVEAEAVLVALPEIALSTGSACASSRMKPSHVLRAMGLDDESVHGSIRFGLGRMTTREDVEYVAERVAGEVARLRRLSPSWAVRHRYDVRATGPGVPAPAAASGSTRP